MSSEVRNDGIESSTSIIKENINIYHTLGKAINQPISASLSANIEFNKYEYEQKKEYKIIKEVNVFDVAAYILNRTGEITTAKLQKLVYYCQAWSLVWDEEPLFKEKIEAWANGPVVRKLFEYHRGNFKIKEIRNGNPGLLSDKQKETIEAVLKYYGEKTANWLIAQTHLEQPWIDARKGLDALERGGREITQDAMADYYGALR